MERSVAMRLRYAWLVVGIAGCLLALTPGPAEATEHCEFVLGFATIKALLDEAEGPDKVGGA